MYKFFLKDTHINSYIAIQRTGSLKHFHWETIGVRQVLPIEPVMTAEDLVGALRYTPLEHSGIQLGFAFRSL